MMKIVVAVACVYAALAAASASSAQGPGGSRLPNRNAGVTAPNGQNLTLLPGQQQGAATASGAGRETAMLQAAVQNLEQQLAAHTQQQERTGAEVAALRRQVSEQQRQIADLRSQAQQAQQQAAGSATQVQALETALRGHVHTIRLPMHTFVSVPVRTPSGGTDAASRASGREFSDVTTNAATVP